MLKNKILACCRQLDSNKYLPKAKFASGYQSALHPLYWTDFPKISYSAVYLATRASSALAPQPTLAAAHLGESCVRSGALARARRAHAPWPAQAQSQQARRKMHHPTRRGQHKRSHSKHGEKCTIPRAPAATAQRAHRPRRK